MTRITILHTIADLHPHSGGTSRVVADFTDALAQSGQVACALVSQGLAGEPMIELAAHGLTKEIAISRSRFSLKFGFPFRRAVCGLMTAKIRPALIHGHGIWLPVNHWSASCARSHGVPYVVQPHGMLEPWALQHRVWKKRIAMRLFQRRDLDAAVLLVATSEQEYRNIRDLGLTQPVAVIPNGVQLEVAEPDGMRPAGGRTVRTALFLSRIHPKKGLMNLIAAWGQIKPVNWRLRIAGPDEGGHLAEVMAAARAHGVEDLLDYIGQVGGERKAQLYREADLFVLPTFSENFGVVVAEALAHGLPVITTRGAPWADLETYGCGWWIDVGVEPLVMALRQAMALRDEEREAMGARGRFYVQRYDWNDIARQTVATYRWLLGEGHRPDCVRTD